MPSLIKPKKPIDINSGWNENRSPLYIPGRTAMDIAIVARIASCCTKLVDGVGVIVIIFTWFQNDRHIYALIYQYHHNCIDSTAQSLFKSKSHQAFPDPNPNQPSTAGTPFLQESTIILDNPIQHPPTQHSCHFLMFHHTNFQTLTPQFGI